MKTKHCPVSAPKPSVVQVRFTNHGSSLPYCNDRYDLQVGDMVYVNGKLEGQRGVVIEVSHNFKIKVSDYKQVIVLINTEVHGEF